MRFTKTLAALATAGTGLTLALAGSAVPAVAATGTYGYDYNAHIVTGGGSDTTYKMMIALSDIYNTASISGCVANTAQTAPGQAVNQCTSTTAPTNSNANYERDTVAQAAPTGSSAGIASMNSDAFINGHDAPGSYPYQGASSPGQQLDFARSSRAPKQSGGNCVNGNELTCNTFWGYAEDGVEVFGFGAAHAGSNVNLTPAQIYGIYSCQITTWGQLLGTADTQPIVPFGLNKASGTYSTFNSYLIANGGAPGGFTVNDHLSTLPYPSGGGCVRTLTTGLPFENDVKPLFSDVENKQGGLATGGVNDPNNWFWFGSYGLLSAFPYDNNYTSKTGTLYSGAPDTVNGVGPSSSTIFGQSYPIVRTLYHATPKTSADCPTSGSACDFAGNPGPTVTGPSGATVSDLNVAGATGGTAGAVREFTRFLCRSSSSQQPLDPYTGTSLATELQGAKTGSGFTSVPTSARTPGSSCQVLH